MHAKLDKGKGTQTLSFDVFFSKLISKTLRKYKISTTL